MHEQSFMPLFGAFGWLAIMLLLGVILRAKIIFFQKFLFPAAIIGGLIGFVLNSVGWCNISHETFTLFAIHLFTINFISIGLTGTDEAETKKDRSIQKTILRGMLWMACLWIATYAFQGLLSSGVVYVTNSFMKPIYQGFGILVPAGFAQGPGQAVALAAVWQNAFKIPDAISFGLTFAAVGFFIASLVGVPLANWGIRKGLSVNKAQNLPKEFLVGLSDEGKGASAGKLTTHSGNVDGVAFQLALVIAVYFLTYYECLFLKYILPGSIKALAFGLMFLWGMITAVIVRWVMGKIKLTRYIDNNVQRRVTGVSVDFMIVATLMAVKVAAIWANIIPIVLMCVVAGLFTFFFILYFGRRLEEYGFERMMALFGTTTGTAASGLLLLRIVDPEFKTPVAAEVGLMNAFALAMVPISFVLYPLPKMGVHIAFLALAAYALVALIILKFSGLWQKKLW